jgi:hypothetical protein
MKQWRELACSNLSHSQSDFTRPESVVFGANSGFLLGLGNGGSSKHTYRRRRKVGILIGDTQRHAVSCPAQTAELFCFAQIA